MHTRTTGTIATAALVAAATLIAFTAPSDAAVTRTYPEHTSIVATTFWVGELFNAKAADGSQVCSTYDSQWAKRWSGKDNGSKAAAGTDCAGAPLGGCDGKPSGTGATFKCATEPRTAANGYYPTNATVTPLENPFYLDLPYDDINDAKGFKNRATDIPWANDPGYTGQATNQSFSYMKNRWVKLTDNGRVCYGQIEDAGPADSTNGGSYYDKTYVFGANDARPLNQSFGGAGTDVSPALNGCLGFTELDGDTDQVSWSWVEAKDVPPGPWTNTVTTSQVEGTTGSAAYVDSITPTTTVAATTTTTPTTTVTSAPTTAPTTTVTTAVTTTPTTVVTKPAPTPCKRRNHHHCKSNNTHHHR